MLVVVLRHGGLGDRRRPVQLLAGAGVRLPARGLRVRRRALSAASAPSRCWRCTATAATTRSATSATRSRTRRARFRGRSCSSILLVAALYMVMTTVILGMIPWTEVQDSRTDRVDSSSSGRSPIPSAGRAGRHRHDGADPVRGGVVALRADSRLLAHSVRGGPGRQLLPVFARVHPTKHFPHVSLVDDRRRVDSVLLLLARPDRELADAGADAAAVHLAVRGGGAAAPLPRGHPAAVHDVALSRGRRRRAGDVGLRVRVGAGERTAVCGRLRRRGRCCLLRVYEREGRSSRRSAELSKTGTCDCSSRRGSRGT